MDGSKTGEVTVHCVCGKRYRIRNAVTGFRTQCPECGSMVEVTESDFDTGFAADGSIRMQDDSDEAKDAILVSSDPIRLAGKGSRLGITDKVVYSNDEALLATAVGGQIPQRYPDTPAPQGAAHLPPAVPRTFVQDMLSSFWFAGNRNNALNLLLTALPSAVLAAVGVLLDFPFNLIVLPFLLIVLAYVVQFYWLVIRTTAMGEDEIPWFESDWSVYEDVFWPLLWVGWFSFMCSLPSLCVSRYLPPCPATAALSWVLLTAGWFFWPVGIMSVAMGNSWVYFRPDWLIRCIAAIGRTYVIVWLLVMAIIAPWYGLMRVDFRSMTATTPFAVLLMVAAVTAAPLAIINLYFGYVLFRILGLMFRHFRDRLPWRF